MAFTFTQHNRVSNIFDNAGQVCLGTIVLGPLLSQVSPNFFVIGIGILAVTAAWTASILISRKGGV